MSSLVVSIPGKSFLAGEYLALKGGPSLVFASEPRFELQADPGHGRIQGIHDESPAGKLIRSQWEFFKNFDLNFRDPHEGRGGWGASTAQFLAAFVLNEWRESCTLESMKSACFTRLLQSYWQFAWNGEGQRPSGADVVAQYTGGLTFFDPESARVSVASWPFHSLDFALVPTGRKLATHEHLRSLGDFSVEVLRKSMEKISAGLHKVDENLFAEGIRDYGAELSRLNFVAPEAAALLESLKAAPGVRAVKGCGALGADVILLVFEKNHRAALETFLAAKDLRIKAGSRDLSPGLSLHNRG